MTTATPFLMFEGHAQDAMNLYVTTFPHSEIEHVERYAQGERGPEGTVKVAAFSLCGQRFMCSDSPVKHNFTFTPANSIFIDCDTAEELEQVFNLLSEDGQVLMPLDNYGFSRRFGWVNDRFGVSWQLNLPNG